MSKNAVAKPETFVIDMPDNADPLGFDPDAASFSWREVMPDNYWNMDGLEARKKALGGWPVLTPKAVHLQPIVDPTEPESKQDFTPKLVLYFVENTPALVLNKSRCEIIEGITGTGNPRLWAARLPRVILMNGIFNTKAQIVLEAAPDEDADRRGAVVEWTL